MKVFYQHGNGNSNVTRALDAQLKEMDISGRDILLKVNMVDPDITKACSNSSRMQGVVDVLRSNGAKSISIGDEPAHYFYEQNNGNIDITACYQNLGYDLIQGAELIDLRNLKLDKYFARKISPATGKWLTRLKEGVEKPHQITVPVRDVSDYLLVNMTMPKHHGNFNYSGVIKNLMGLVPNEERMRTFHFGFENAAFFWVYENKNIGKKKNEQKEMPTEDEVKGKAEEFFQKFAGRYIQNQNSQSTQSFDLVDNVVKMFRDRQLGIDSTEAHFLHICNMGAIHDLYFHMLEKQPDAVHILDGTYVLSKQEHDGTPVQTDFAIVSQDPGLIDSSALHKIGIDREEVPYVNRTPYRGAAEVAGDIGPLMPNISVLEKEVKKDSKGRRFAFVKIIN